MQSTGKAAQESVAPARAAALAAYNYVYSKSYQEGRQEGWNAGWNAAFRSLQSSMNSQMRKTANSPRRLREQTVREVTEIDGNANGPEQGSDSESAEATEFELTEEWTDIFRNSNRRSDKRQGGVRKKRRVSFGEENAPEEEQPQLDFGGLAERGRSTKARSLYGEGADDVLAMETALEADFADAVTKHSAEFWPVVPLKQGERPKLL